MIDKVKIADGWYLDELAKAEPLTRETYGNDPDNKPNDHCVWRRELPTTTSGMAWVENDEHFRNRIKARLS